MGDLSRCKLCKCEPRVLPTGKIGHSRASYCVLASADPMYKDQWQTLMAAPGGEAVAERSPKAPGGINWLCETLPERGAKLYLHPAPAVDDDVLLDAVADAIGPGTYDCSRVWSAWGYGTMSEDDFTPIINDINRLQEIVDAVKAAMKGEG